MFDILIHKSNKLSPRRFDNTLVVCLIGSLCSGYNMRTCKLRITDERRIMIKMFEELHKDARVRAAELGLPVSEIVRQLFREWSRIEISDPPPESENNTWFESILDAKQAVKVLIHRYDFNHQLGLTGQRLKIIKPTKRPG